MQGHWACRCLYCSASLRAVRLIRLSGFRVETVGTQSCNRMLEFVFRVFGFCGLGHKARGCGTPEDAREV